MSTTNQHTPFSSTCVHKNVVEDYKEGSIICSDCALVVDERIFVPTFQPKLRRKLSDNDVFLADVCDRMHLPHHILDCCIDYYNKLKLETAIIANKFKPEEVAAYVLYQILIQEDAPRTIPTIEHYTGIHRHTLWKIESTQALNDTNVLEACALIEGYCAMLGLAFYHATILKTITSRIHDFGAIHPNSLCAVVIYLYCKQQNLGPTMRKVCEICYVSSPNIHKLIRRLEKKYVADITLFQRISE
jgi:transcription initiation factor TFIIIB Brf1 subunit/transcription initiation factor TFIIB